MTMLGMLTSPLISKFYGNGDPGVHGCYQQGIGKKLRKQKKAKRRAEKKGRRNSR